MPGVCLFVCLSVCVSVSNFTYKLLNGRATTVGTGGDWSPTFRLGTNNVLVPQLLGRSFQTARIFTASRQQIAGFSIWVFKNFPGVIPPDPHSGRGATTSRTQHPAQILVPLNFSAVLAPLWTDLHANSTTDVSVITEELIKFWKSFASGSRNFLKDSLTLLDRAFFHTFAYISGDSDRIFRKILSLMYPLTNTSRLTFGVNLNTESWSKSPCETFPPLMPNALQIVS